MARSRRVLTIVLGLAAAAVLVAAWVLLSLTDPAQQSPLVITTGTKGGTYIKLGQLLAPLLEDSGEAIGKVSSVPSEGSFENIRRLEHTGDDCKEDPNAPEPEEGRDSPACKAHLALVVAPAAVNRPNVKVLMTLYDDVLQLVACNLDEEVETLSDLRGNHRYRIFVGNDGSATKRISEGVLSAAGIKYKPIKAAGFKDASVKLVKGDPDDALDAAFFMAGTPVEAVSHAMDSGRCKLLSVKNEVVVQKMETEFGLTQRRIPPHLYENQASEVQTLQASALLVAREDLSPDVVETVLNVVFERISDLAVANIRANEIRLWKAFDLPDERLELHRGAKKFEAMERHALLIATGSLGGKYHNVGKMSQLLLQQQTIRTLGDATALLWGEARADPSVIPRLLDRDRARARVVHTEGSLENARLLEERPTLAIMQYDVALASRLNKSSIYRAELPGVEFPELPNLKRIATLHTETLHVVVQRGKVTPEELRARGLEPQDPPTVQSLKGLKVCLGPEKSGTRVIAEAVLEHHKVSKDEITPSYLMVPDMVHRLHSEDIDAAFFVSGMPSHAVQTILEDPELRLLSLGPRERAQIVESAPFDAASIPADTYAGQLKGEPPIQTIATRAILVTNGDLPFDVETITKAIFEGAAFLDVGGSALEVTTPSIATSEEPRKRLLRFMGQGLPSLPLHPDARAYYEKADLLPPRPTLVDWIYDWLTATWRTLTVLLILATAYAGFIKLKRDRTGNGIGRQILKTSREVTERISVSKLLKILSDLQKIRRDIEERVRRRWWQLGELDKPRWRYLHDLINDRAREAKENLARALVAELRHYVEDRSLDDAKRLDRRAELLRRVRQHFEAGELEASQSETLTNLIQKEMTELASDEVR